MLGRIAGGISVAPVLGMPEEPARYAIMPFVVIVQGGTLGRIFARAQRRPGPQAA